MLWYARSAGSLEVTTTNLFSAKDAIYLVSI
jgi:hypothetical protein